MSKFYVLDENNNKVEAFDKQGVLAVLAQAIADGSLENITADAAFISKLKCCVGGDTFQMAFITQAKYNELVATETVQENTYYFIIDDESDANINEILENINGVINSLTNRIQTLETQASQALNELGKRQINGVINCYTNDAAKQIYIDNFNLVEGTELIVKFSHYGGANQWQFMTLTVNNGTPYPLYYLDKQISIEDITPAFEAGNVLRLYFDGTKWQIKENITKNTTYTYTIG